MAGIRLTEQKKLWASYYITHWNAKRAAIQAGASEGEAYAFGRKQETCPVVGQYIAYLVKARNKRVKADADYVLKRLVEIDELDVADLLNDDGHILPVKKWPKAWRTSINGLDFGKLVRAQDDPNKILQLIEKIKWPDKVANLKLLGQHVDVKAWDHQNQHGDSDSPPLQINFTVAEPKADMRVTNADP